MDRNAIAFYATDISYKVMICGIWLWYVLIDHLELKKNDDGGFALC